MAVNPEPSAPAAKPDETDWKAEARKWEARAKEYKPAADELAAIKESQKSDAEKAAERLAAAEAAAAEANAKVLRRDIAIEHGLTAEDTALLDTITDEDAMRSLATRLAPSGDDGKPRAPRPDPNQGRPPSGAPASTGDLFAATMRDLIR